MNMKYEIVKYRPEFKGQIIELQTHLWSPDVSLNTAYLEWKYERNPYVDTPLIYMALCDGKVVGMRGMLGARWEIGSGTQTFNCLCAGDLVIAPNHRNNGVFTKIMNGALNDLANHRYQYVFNLSAGRLTFIGSLAMGWRSAGSLHMKIRHSRQKNNIKVEEFNPFNNLDRNMKERALGINPRLSVGHTPRPRAMANLIKKICYDGRIRHVRDEHFFEWRFRNPLSEYRFLYWGGSSLEGYLVLRAPVYKDKTKVSIVDWEATNFQIKSHLLHEAIRLGDFELLSIWSATLSDQEKALLKYESFKYSEQKGGVTRYQPTVLIRPVLNGMLGDNWVLANRALLDLNNWDLRMIYSDAY